MIKLILFILIDFGVLLGCQNQKTSTNQSVKIENFKSRDTFIPETLKTFIKANFVSLRIPTRDNYVKDWESYKSDSIPPFCCTSDFDGDGIRDYCLLLSKDKKELYLYAFLTTNKSFNSVLIDTIRIQDSGIDAVLSIQNKGEWESVDNKINVPNDGITVDLIEESISWSYYWTKNGFVKFLYD